MTTTHKTLPQSTFWRITEDIPESLKWTLMVSSIIVPLIFWLLISSFAGIESVFLPSPLAVIQALGKLAEQGFLIQDTITSFLRVVGGFFLGGLFAIPLGILMGTFPSIRSLMEPIIGVVRYMPAPAFIPLLVIYLGIGETSKIMLIFTYIIPNIIDTFRVNMAAAWNLVVVAELVAADNGLGKRILLAQKFLRTDEIFACLIVLGIIGFALDLSFRLFLHWTCKWSITR